MKTIWQVRRAAFGRTLRAIALSAARTPRNKQTTRPPRTYHWRSIGTLALLAGAFLLPAFAAQAQIRPNIVVVSSSENPSHVGDTVTFTVSVSDPGNGTNGTPTGTVKLIEIPNTQFGNTATLSQTANGTAQATVSVTFSTTGTFGLFATYSGDGVFQSGTAINSFNQQVIAAAAVGTTTQLATSQNPSEVNQPVTFTATVTADSGTTTPSGNVAFQDNGTQIGTGTLNGAGVATFTTSSLTAATHNITAVYNFDNGNANFGPQHVQQHQPSCHQRDSHDRLGVGA